MNTINLYDACINAFRNNLVNLTWSLLTHIENCLLAMEDTNMMRILLFSV